VPFARDPGELAGSAVGKANAGAGNVADDLVGDVDVRAPRVTGLGCTAVDSRRGTVEV
jgi:hypothetical protein